MTRFWLTCVWLLAVASVHAEELRLDARALFERAVTHHLRLSDDGTAIELTEGELIEDDGPAAGYSYKPNEEVLSERVFARKELVITNPRTHKATLLVAPGGETLRITINGKEVNGKRESIVGGYWSAYPIPRDSLKAGTNEIVIGGKGKVWIARAEDFAAGSTTRMTHPKRSARSHDSGTTWARDQLGPKGDIDGEYCVRLFLDRTLPSGSLTLPVIDLGNLADKTLPPPVAWLGPVCFEADAGLGASSKLVIRARTGTCPQPDAKTWSAWATFEAKGEIREPSGRYLQLAFELSTADPRELPRLRSLVLEARVERPEKDWTETVIKNTTIIKPDLVRSSIPFVYEPFDHPRLKALRETHKLDELVKGATNEFEIATRLARWSAKRWERGHLKDAYPPWDANEILRLHADGTPTGGFCQQYNLVFLQACESFGIPGRAMSIGPGDIRGPRGGGHEVVEVWLNHFQKWAYIDGNMAWFARDKETMAPLSLLELRERQLAQRAGRPFAAIVIEHLLDDGKRWQGLDAWPPFDELRLIPRSNFLEAKAPLPLNQGMRGWFWTGHHVWTDAASPASVIYRHRESNPRNWNWSLNETRLTLEPLKEPGEFRVHLDTVSPYFDTFIAKIDGKERPVAGTFVWKLHKGHNSLIACTRDKAGRQGYPSTAAFDCP